MEFPVGTLKHLGLKKGDRIGWNLTFSNGATSIGGLPVPADGTKARKSKG